MTARCDGRAHVGLVTEAWSQLWPNYSPAKLRGLFQPSDLQSAGKISRVLYLQQVNDLFLWLLGAAWGMKGRGTAADTKARFCECSKTGSMALLCTITGGLLLHNHRHYRTNTHLGSSCRVAMDDHKTTSS